MDGKKVFALNFSSRYCALRPAPQVRFKGQAVACPIAAGKTGTYRSLRSLELAALVPSAGTISFEVELRSARVSSAPVSVGPYAACGAPSPCIERRKPPLTRLLQGIRTQLCS